MTEWSSQAQVALRKEKMSKTSKSYETIIQKIIESSSREVANPYYLFPEQTGMEHTRAMVTITPEAATEVLKLNTTNRDISPAHVTKMVREYERGMWQPAMCLAFSDDPALLDGQHRLKAQTKGKFPWRYELVFDLDKSMQLSVDSGRDRRKVDHLRMRGIPSKIATPMVGLAEIYRKGDNRHKIISLSDSKEFLDDNPWVENAILSAKPLYEQMQILKHAPLAYCYREFKAVDSEAAEQYWDILMEPLPQEEGSPLRQLQKFVYRPELDRGPEYSNLSYKHTIGMMVNAWNAWRGGETIRFNPRPSEVPPIL